MLPNEVKTFKRTYARTHHIYIQSGRVTQGRWLADKATGGVATAVRKELVQKMVHHAASPSGDAQVQTTQVGGWLVVNFYKPPGREQAASLALLSEELE